MQSQGKTFLSIYTEIKSTITTLHKRVIYFLP